MEKLSIFVKSTNNYVPVKEEKDKEGSKSLPPTTAQKPPETNAFVKPEPQELTSEEMSVTLLPPSSSEKQNQNQKDKEEDVSAKLVKSVNELGNLSDSIHLFKRRFDELQKHLDFIEKAIDTRSQELSLPSTTQNTAPSSQANALAALPPKPNSDAGKEKKTDSDSNLKPKPETCDVYRSHDDEVQSLCQSMCSRGLRRYVVSRLSYAAKLRLLVPEAIKCAPNPAKLVFECMGRFFLQGSKAYTKDSPMVSSRQASILILELFLLSGCVKTQIKVDPSLKEEASSAAISWRKRLVVEGGIHQACEEDARGLLLLVASFGIPNVFKIEDITDLILLSNPREISNALCQSHVLLKKVPDIIEGMMRKGMAVEAVDVADTFGLEGKYSPKTIFTSFLQKSEEAWKRTRQGTHSPPVVLKKADEKHLAALKSVAKFLEDHKIDPLELLPGWKIKEKIINLEKDISDFKKKMEDKVILKRKIDGIEPSNKLNSPDIKRPRITAKLLSPSVSFLQEQKIGPLMDGKSSYYESMAVNMLDGRDSSHWNNYPALPTVQFGSIESVTGTTVANGSGLHATVGNGMSAGVGVLSPASFSRLHGEMVSDEIGRMMNNNVPLYRCQGIGESAILNDNSVGQSLGGQPASTRVNSFYALSSSIQGFVGMRDHSCMGSDLYSFADAL
ncbi:FRIGIDA-like protein [Quillaja saponaria]|uniref:FRIGIDA-like protein n=1 Tax=Quillaja saponaria TaxID=32244 RepID=A0AAD7P7J2_QUISA|nr:FRIGIDA-like protein [Quillaja saponaria]